MTKPLRWIFWIAAIGMWWTPAIHGEFFLVSKRPVKSSSLYNQLEKEMYCVTDELDSALVLNHHLDWKYDSGKPESPLNKPVVIRNDAFVYPTVDNLTCSMSSYKTCANAWNKPENSWFYTDSLRSPMAPVFDNRWEDFKVEEMTDRFVNVTNLPSSGALAVSVRGSSDAHFAICNAFESPENQFCYFVILGGWKNSKSVIRKCESGIAEPAIVIPSTECQVNLAVYNDTILSTAIWKTFVFKWEFRSDIVLEVYDAEKKILNHRERRPREDYFPGHFQFQTRTNEYSLSVRSRGKMLMKFHKYSYSMTRYTQAKLSSPPFMTHSSDQRFCIEMAFNMCPYCMLLIDLVDKNGVKKSVSVVNGNNAKQLPYGLRAWNNVKIEYLLTGNMSQPIVLVINNLLKNNTYRNDSFWAISNIRRCHDGEFKYLKMNNRQDYSSFYEWPNVTCQKISKEGVSEIISTINNKPAYTKNSFLCEKGKIGKSCMAKCSLFTPYYSECQDLLACDKSGCFCAPGYKMPACSDQCDDSTYGYNCTYTCGHCAAASCNKATGNCEYGCEESDTNLFFPPDCKRGIGPPSPPSTKEIDFTRVKIDLHVKEEYTFMPTTVVFEVSLVENVTDPVFVSNKTLINKNDLSISMYAEHLIPGTKYKVMGILQAGNKTFRGEWKHFTTGCTEALPIDFVIRTINETTVLLDIKRVKHITDSCPDNWYNIQVTTAKDTVFDGSTSFPKVLGQLQPDTVYKFHVKSEQSENNILQKSIRTPEGAPTMVEDFESIPTTIDKLTLQWSPPRRANGKILNYTVEIKPVESHGCKDLGLASYNTSNDSELNQFLTRSVHKNDPQNSFSVTFNNLRPYTTYLVTAYASTSVRRGEKRVFYHTTDSLKTPTEIFSNLHLANESNKSIAATLHWDPPSDCQTNTGPIRSSKLIIKKLNETLIDKEIEVYYYPLEKKFFNGLETYEAHLCSLRSPGGDINETACTDKNFTMPAREPSPVRNLKIIEVDTLNHSTTLRWQAPTAPLNGILAYYAIQSCDKSGKQCQKSEKKVLPNELCKYSFRNEQDIVCQTIPLPLSDLYTQIQITAYNDGVTNGSKPEAITILREEFIPSAPINLTVRPLNEQNSTVIVSWYHPVESGGKIVSFQIDFQLSNTYIKHPPVTKLKTYFKNITDYHYEYSTEINILPASTYEVFVNAITQEEKPGLKANYTIEMPNLARFRTRDLKSGTQDESTTIDIIIPEVIYDIKNSVVVIMLQGPNYCDESGNKNNGFDENLNEVNNTYYKVKWIAASLTNIVYNNRFTIGDGYDYGGFKNHFLCPKESYIVSLFLVDGVSNSSKDKSKKLSLNILDSVITNPISIGQLPKYYAMWLTPLLFVILIVALMAYVLYRKNSFVANKTKSEQQDSKSLSNDSDKKLNNLIEEVETGIKIKDEKFENGIPMNNVFIVDKKRIFDMPVKIEDFKDYFETTYKSGKLRNEYSSILYGPSKKCEYGSKPETKPKNRYANLFPYDESRVVLEKISEEPYSDYINANFISGYGGKEKAYIATQGPKPNTVEDFWRMIWQENVKIICMMTNLVENEKIKCEQYWPSTVGKKTLYGVILVQFSSEKIHSDYTYRVFNISCGTYETRTIEHLHYTAWPDHGVPSNPRSMVSFVQELQKHAPLDARTESPIVVHCSAGVGRTGTLIVLDICLQQAFFEKAICIFDKVLTVRQGRLNMVDNADQYILIHVILIEYFHTQDTCFVCDETLLSKLEMAINESKLYHKRIFETNWWIEYLESPPLPEKSLSDRNRAKHRYPETAVGLNRLFLKRSIRTDEDSDYIAATCVRNVFKDCQYITTQLPLPTTLADFWRMMSELNVEYVLVLQLPDFDDETYCNFIPDSQEFGSTSYLKIIRQQNSSTVSQYYFQDEVLIIDSSEQPSKTQTVKILSYKNWPKHSLPPPNELVKLWKVFNKLPKTNEHPIVIACDNGVTASGIWLASLFLLRNMTVYKECDVPRATQAIRRCRKDFLDQPEYYEYLYKIASAWFTEEFPSLQ